MSEHDQDSLNAPLLEEVKMKHESLHMPRLARSISASLYLRTAKLQELDELEETPQGDDVRPSTRLKLELMTKLVNMGFSSRMVGALLRRIEVSNIHAAIDMLVKTSSGWAHTFLPLPSLGVCEICEEPLAEHVEALAVDIEPTPGGPEALDGADDLVPRPPVPDDLNVNVRPEEGLRLPRLSDFESPATADRNQCKICFEAIPPNEAYTLGCGHTHCLRCIRGYLEANITSGVVIDLKCPEDGCDYKFEKEDIQHVCPPAMFEKYMTFVRNVEVTLNKNLKYCPRPNCGRVVEGSASKPHIICECGFHFCFKCGEAWHRGSCARNYQRLYDNWAAGQNLQRCPNCRIRIEKNRGCNHMTCTFCHYQWCWLCGQKYSYSHFDSSFFGCALMQYTSSDWGLCRIFLYNLFIFLFWPLLIFGYSWAFVIPCLCDKASDCESCSCLCYMFTGLLIAILGTSVGVLMFIPTYFYRFYTLLFSCYRLCRGN